MSEFVVWFDSSEAGAPVLNNAAGSLIGVLDACLVTGFNPKTLTSLTVSGGVATATLNGHGYSGTYSKDVLVAGATPALLNGRKQLTAVTANTFTFPAPGVADGPATGTITTKRDSLGWVKEFTGTNKAIYKRSDVTATTMKLRVVDSAATAPSSVFNARVQMVEAATDVDTVTNARPSNTQITDGFGQHWNKGENTATAKQWTLIGDSKMFYLITQSGAVILPGTNAQYASFTMAFGDFVSIKPGDAYNCLLSGGTSNSSGGGTTYGQRGLGGNTGTVGTPPAIGHFIAARPHHQLLNDAPIGTVAPFTMSSGNSTVLPYPSPIDNGFFLATAYPVIEAVAGGMAIRGFVPGYCFLLSHFPIPHHQLLSDVPSLPGRRILGIRSYADDIVNCAFDLTGPWR